jgi:hypothetical protein
MSERGGLVRIPASYSGGPVLEIRPGDGLLRFHGFV